MKTIKLGLAAVTLMAAVVFTSCKEEAKTEEVVVEEVVVEDVSGDFIINPDASSFEWLGTKVTGEHTGTIDLAEGYFTLNNGALESGVAVIDMSTIKVTDIEDEEMNAKLYGHLTTEDFFAIESFPTAKLNVTSTEGNLAKGTLEIKSIVQPIEFEYTLNETESDVTLSGTLVVDRTLYEIQYGSGKFFDNLGDKTISDEFELTFKAVASK